MYGWSGDKLMTYDDFLKARNFFTFFFHKKKVKEKQGKSHIMHQRQAPSSSLTS